MISFIDKLKLDKKKVLLVILACLIIAFIDFSTALKAQMQELKAKIPKITELQKKIDTLSKELAQMRNLRQEQIQAKEAQSVRTKKILSEQKINSLFENISELSNKYNIKIIQIRPSKEIAGKKEVNSKTAKLTPFYIKLDLYCKFHNFGAFLNDLENGQIWLMLDEIRISRDSVDEMRENINLTLKTYVKK